MDERKVLSSFYIRILNFEDNETVTYPIVKLLGIIENFRQRNIDETEKYDGYISLTINSTENGIKSSVFEEKFKLFCELQLGCNNLRLTFNRQILSLVLNYCPNQSEYSVIPLYIICDGHDGKFQAPDSENNDIESACKRITLAAKLLQCFTAEKLHENGMGKKTFQIRNACQVFHSQLNYLDARKMSERELWSILGREIMQSKIGCEKLKYLAFLSCTFYNSAKYRKDMTTHENLLDITEGYVALGGGGLALFGTACLFTWPLNLNEINEKFIDKTAVDRSQFLDDSCYRGTLGACFSTTLGSVLHELYHSFDLGHTQYGIMGRGFDNIYKFFIWPPKQDVASSDAQKSFKRNQEIVKSPSVSFKTQVEFKEEFEAEKLSQRLEQENQTKGFTIIKKIEEEDDTFLTKSCAVTLCYHKWFNSFPLPKNSFSLTYDSSNKLIKSTLGIRVVEIRRHTDEMVLQQWAFEGKVLKFSYQIPQSAVLKKTRLLFVQDSCGNILKETV